MPPDFDNLPIPKSKKTKDVNSSLEAAIGTNNSNSEPLSNLENMILKELRKKP